MSVRVGLVLSTVSSASSGTVTVTATSSVGSESSTTSWVLEFPANTDMASGSMVAPAVSSSVTVKSTSLTVRAGGSCHMPIALGLQIQMTGVEKRLARLMGLFPGPRLLRKTPCRLPS